MISAVKACADLMNRIWVDETATRCGVARCAVSRTTGDYLIFNQLTPQALCGVARCGASYCNYVPLSVGVYAGMIPTRCHPGTSTAALTEELGGPADPRQKYDTAFDNPAFTLHLIGDDMLWLDKVAHRIMERLDCTGHYKTIFGTVNGIRINPPKRTVRDDRPRYDIQLLIEMEIARP